MREKILFIVCTMVMLFCADTVFGKDVKISVIPSDAKIYIDGKYVADGVVTTPIKRREGFIVVKAVKEGYVTFETKIFFRDKRKTISYTLRRDAFFEISAESELVNDYFSVTVSKDMYKVDENGKRNTDQAWKMIHQIILNYFDEIKITDMNSGFVQTPWLYKSFPATERQIRTRISIKEGDLDGDLVFEIKISSEVASLFAGKRDESFQKINRIVKELEPMIIEFKSRLGEPEPEESAELDLVELAK